MAEQSERLEKVERAVAEITTKLDSLLAREEQHQSTQNNARAQLEETVISPIDTAVNAADINRDFDRLRSSLTKLPVPNELNVNDSPVGVKQESKGALKILSKCARHAETGIKVLSKINKEPSEEGKVEVNIEELDSLFIVFASQIAFLQQEYANIIVKSTFNDETARIFRSFENNASAFNPSALQNVRVAAELAATQSRVTASYNQPRVRSRGGFYRGRGYSYAANQNPPFYNSGYRNRFNDRRGRFPVNRSSENEQGQGYFQNAD